MNLYLLDDHGSWIPRQGEHRPSLAGGALRFVPLRLKGRLQAQGAAVQEAEAPSGHHSPLPKLPLASDY